MINTSAQLNGDAFAKTKTGQFINSVIKLFLITSHVVKFVRQEIRIKEKNFFIHSRSFLFILFAFILFLAFEMCDL